MKFFDFNIHPNFRADGLIKDIDQAILDELTCTPDELIKAFENTISTDASWKKYEGVNYMIFTNYFHKYPKETKTFVKNMIKMSNVYNIKAYFTFLIDPRSDNSRSLVEEWYKAGVNFIKFHSYHQKISQNEISQCVEIAKTAEMLDIGICIDASYGTKYLYKYDNLLLATEILGKVEDVPVVILHAGGLRAHEAALIVQDSNNAYIELSFSHIFYRDTSVYLKFLDILKMVPHHKFLYASDFPYVNIDTSINFTEKLLKDANLGANSKGLIYNKNASKIFNDLAKLQKEYKIKKMIKDKGLE